MVSELKKRPRPRPPSFTMPVAVMNTLAGLMSAGEGEGGWCGVCRGCLVVRGRREEEAWGWAESGAFR